VVCPLHGSREDSRELATAIGLYLLDEINVGKASERVGLSRWEMQDLLAELDVDTREGLHSLEEVQAEVDVALKIEQERLSALPRVCFLVEFSLPNGECLDLRSATETFVPESD
jgi:predicted HTH domain antitoxin